MALQTDNTSSTTGPAVITMDGSYLALTKARLAERPASLMPAYEKLLQDAAALLALEAEAVTRKKIVPPSGDKHDYMSLAPYWWPNPDTPDGLPYVQRDGEFNPSSKNGDTDSVRMQTMCMGIQCTSLAYYFTDDARYAAKTAEFIRTWFITPETRMNPNLRYGQAVMGRFDGRGIGLIDTRNLWMVTDAVQLLEGSGALSAAEVNSVKMWMKEFADWMLNSNIGIDEFNAHNNHGTFYDMQIASYMLFAGDLDTARRAVQRALELRINGQISIEGKQYAELERTTPFHYCAFNLDAMMNVARYGEQVGVDVWKVREKGRGLRNALNYLIPFAVAPATWPYKELRGHAETELAMPLLLKAARAYGDDNYSHAVTQLEERSLVAQEYIALYKAIGLPHPTTSNSVDRLIWPVK
ncbi:MAG: hypothetical protein JWL63_2570 [Rhodocyclales bacterium]|nr:hypothetical protein [Rhodocyclales bacterium]